MRIVDQTEVQLEWSDMENLTYHPRPKMVRSSGVHVSGILKYIAIKMGKLSDEDQKDEMPLVVLLGSAFEEMAARLYRDMIWQPGELTRDGIIGSPDGISEAKIQHYASLPAIDEFKFTYKSERTHGNIVNEWLWMQQIMAYLNMHPLRLQFAKLHVCWACGDYRPPFPPKMYNYVIQFNVDELVNNWVMMCKYRDRAVEEVH